MDEICSSYLMRMIQHKAPMPFIESDLGPCNQHNVSRESGSIQSADSWSQPGARCTLIIHAAGPAVWRRDQPGSAREGALLLVRSSSLYQPPSSSITRALCPLVDDQCLAEYSDCLTSTGLCDRNTQSFCPPVFGILIANIFYFR